MMPIRVLIVDDVAHVRTELSLLLSLGSGPGGVEMVFARECPEADYVCMDVNAGLLALGRERAAAEGLAATFDAIDLARHCTADETVTDLVLRSLLWHLDRIVDYVDRGASPEEAAAGGGPSCSASGTRRRG